MDTKGLQKEFISWCKSKNKSPKTKEETQQLFVSFMKEKHPEEYKKAVESQLQQQAQQVQKNLHGAKLQYFRKLKNQCAEDEEVVYYKKGGSVNCGCKKKEDGGEVRKDCGGSAIDKFKAKMKSGGDTSSIANRITNNIATITNTKQGFDNAKKIKENSSKKSTNVVVNGTTKQPMEEAQRKNTKKPFKNDYSSKRVKDSEKDYLEGKTNEATAEKCGGKVKKKAEGSKINKDCGGAVAKFKALRKGGSLNGIPFYLGGTNEGGIKKEIKLPEYMTKLLIGYPSILPGRYTGLERLTPGVFRMFKTWVKGLPKTLTPADYISVGAGAAGGIGLGYDDTHDLYVRKWITNTGEKLQPSIEWTPFSANKVVESVTSKPKKKSFKK